MYNYLSLLLISLFVLKHCELINAIKLTNDTIYHQHFLISVTYTKYCTIVPEFQ